MELCDESRNGEVQYEDFSRWVRGVRVCVCVCACVCVVCVCVCVCVCVRVCNYVYIGAHGSISIEGEIDLDKDRAFDKLWDNYMDGVMGNIFLFLIFFWGARLTWTRISRLINCGTTTWTDFIGMKLKQSDAKNQKLVVVS